jgi:hypothetical protein
LVGVAFSKDPKALCLPAQVLNQLVQDFHLFISCGEAEDADRNLFCCASRVFDLFFLSPRSLRLCVI